MVKAWETHHVDTLDCNSRVHNYPLTTLQDPDGHLGLAVLLCNQRTDIRLNAAST